MRARQWIGSFSMVAMLLVSMPALPAEPADPSLILAAIDIGASRNGRSTPGFMSCRDLGRQLVRNWLGIRDLLAPQFEGKERPDKDSFECISAAYTRGMFEISASRASGLRCFRPTEVHGRGICCDSRMAVCAYYNG